MRSKRLVCFILIFLAVFTASTAERVIADETNPEAEISIDAGWETEEESGKVKYRKEDGAYAQGWLFIDENWYWFDEDGFRSSGWIKPAGAWYYLEADGKMTTGWKYLDQKWYYLDPVSGAMKEGWLKWNNNWYYLFPGSGAMASGGWYTINGKNYCFYKGGSWNQNAELWTLTSAIDTAAANAGWYVSVTNGSLADDTIKKLNDDMLAMWNAGFDIGFLLLDIYSGTVVTGNPNKYFYSASTLKGPYACAIALKDPYRAADHKDLIWSTISQSNNETYLSLRNMFGSGAMSSYMSEAGVSGVSPSENYTDERVKDLAKLWVRNHEYFCQGEANVSWLRPYFRHTKNSYINASIGYRHIVYSKAGWEWGPTSHHVVFNDGGIVMKAGAPYILVILSNGRSGTDDGKLQAFVRDLDAAHTELTGVGWIYENDNWYYLGSEGKKLTGWQFINGNWYYMKADGSMAAEEWVEGYYWVSKSGAWKYEPKGSWKKNQRGWWFGDTSGWYAKNETIKINNVDYSFDAEGYWIEETE
ncbi:MAG: hypothetical protein Q4D15_02550 [Lachnospiraceae bacterium]|nr:hypothetical protein [Lachnospiraceae bacterium]